ncbi:MAG: hypothetical protein OHM77_04315 [Candidatus Nitricoxidivorans perseverans]|uniref:Uncharacterized protein n=1 Tax=Candidatus Nitricoxidivorans perseverans TaxID=2975601 RepID=A0AA49J181_9PROT|nr:MAG: hypothetical protein OHM77_04315 [Candidatus Nitricoxidivorans perseverans]
MNEPTIVVPVSLLLDLYHQASAVGREQIEIHIRDYKKSVDPKGHVAEGFRKTAEGSLVFDYALYDEAIYRGKVDTYAKNAKEHIEKLRDSLEMLQEMSGEQQKALLAIPLGELGQRIGLGKPISENDIKLLQQIQPLLKNDPEA